MIYELEQGQFYKCEKLVCEERHVEVRAIVDGTNPGRLFVDDLASPRTAMVWLGNLDGFGFMGDPTNRYFNEHLNTFIDKTIGPEAKVLGLKQFEAFGHHPVWDDTLQKLFAHRGGNVWTQNVYKVQDHFKQQGVCLTPPGYRIAPITPELLTDASILNADFGRSKILKFWPSLERFFAKGIGCCAMTRNEIVSLCFSGFVAGVTHGIDIETLNEHRGQKLAQAAAHWLATECLNRSFLPYWDCTSTNTASIAVAERIGFCFDYSYFLHGFRFG